MVEVVEVVEVVVMVIFCCCLFVFVSFGWIPRRVGVGWGGGGGVGWGEQQLNKMHKTDKHLSAAFSFVQPYLRQTS